METTTLENLVHQMLQAEFYPHPVTQPIQVIQTHVSWVVLTGDYVYKLKKSVNFGFLDYSTLDRRLHFCQEELRLNQRGASKLYLQVVPITWGGGKYHLGGKGEIVEYGVKMRQFPQDALFSQLLSQGKLNQLHLQELGRVLAEYHTKCLTNDYISGFGQVGLVRSAIEENYIQTLKYIEKYSGGPQTQSRFEETKAYTDKFCQQYSELFASRIAQQRIRECHGDLHLANIALWNEEIILFDCIEFNETFRFVDVMYDVAFTVMDLETKGREDLANTFLNTYVEETGDWEGLQILPLYLTRQAYVRAKVNSFLLDDKAIGLEARAIAAQTAEKYYQQAWKYTQPRQGQLILMSGLSGSGKSTTGRYLAAKLGAVHLRSDAVRKHLGGISLRERGSNEIYTPEMTEKTYNRLLVLGITLANQGWSVILDAKYDRKHLRQQVIDQANKHQLPGKIVYCTAPLEVLEERILHRSCDITDATPELLAGQVAQYEPFTEEELPYIMVVDTTQPLAQQFNGKFR